MTNKRIQKLTLLNLRLLNLKIINASELDLP